MSSREQARDFFESLRPGQVMVPLFDAVPGVFYFVKDRRSRFVAASRGFVELMGADRLEDLLGKTDYDFGADFLAEGFIADDRKVVASGRSLLNKVELVPSGGSLDWLITTKIPLFDRKGKVAGLAGVTRVTGESDALYRDHPEMRLLIDYVRVHFRRRVAVPDLAGAVGISVSSVERHFRRTFRMSPAKFLRRMRINAACHGLRTTDLPLARIARDFGFSGQAGMTRDFRKELDLTPAKYRARYRSATSSLQAA
jgi:AraC-like DNA-binding protein